MISAVFALFLGLNVWNFASSATPCFSDRDVPCCDRNVPCRDGVPLQTTHSLDDVPASAAILGSHNVAHYLQAQSRGQRLLLRSLRMGSLDGFGGRGSARREALAVAKKIYLPLGVNRAQYPSSFAFRYPKDYFVYTLERMLC